MGVEFLNWQIINLTTLEKEIKIENPLTYIMPDSDIRVAADFNDDPIDIPDIPIDPPPSPSPTVEVYFKVLTTNETNTMGYTVTLYSPKGSVIWQGVTNSQGYVQLDPTLSFYAEDGMTLRAMKGSKFTQITVNKDTFSADKADSNNEIWITLTVGEMGETTIPTGYLGTQDKSVARTTFTVPVGIERLQIVNSPGVYIAVTPNKTYTVEKKLYPQGSIRCTITNVDSLIEWMSLRCPTVEVAEQRIASMQLYFAYSPNINTASQTVTDNGKHSGGDV